MNETTMIVPLLLICIASMAFVAVFAGACCWLVWRACSKASGIDAADRVLAANADVMRGLRSSNESAMDLVGAERKYRVDEQLLSAWMAKQIIEAHSAGKDGKPIVVAPMDRLPAELDPDHSDHRAHSSSNNNTDRIEEVSADAVST